MRVQPHLPSSPFTAIVTSSFGSARVGVQRGEEAGAAGAEDQEISLEFLHAPVTGP